MKFLDRVAGRIERHLSDARILASFRHLHGPRKFHLGHADVALVLVGRNNAQFLAHNIAYHRALGVTHVVYVDNGSQDSSVEVVKSFPNTMIYSSTADFRSQQRRIRKFAVSRVNDGAWVLAIDCDELFDYYGADRVKLPALVERISGRGFTGIVAQMLDLVPDVSLEAAAAWDFSEAVARFDAYSLKGIQRESYHEPAGKLYYFTQQNRVHSDGVEILYGGLRRAAFSEECCLTKHALFRKSKGINPMVHPHVSTGLVVADFTALLRHYKFACGVVEREKALVREKRMANGEIERRVDLFGQKPETFLIQYAELREPTVDKLVDAGFLFVADDAKDMLDL